MMRERLKKGWLPALLFALVVASAMVLRQQAESVGREGGRFFHLAGAIRVFAMDAIWMRMSAHQQEGNERLVLSDARTLLALDPEGDSIRAFLFQHLAMTMARKAASEEEAQAWIHEGLALLDEGIALDENRPPKEGRLAEESGLHEERRLAEESGSHEGGRTAEEIGSKGEGRTIDRSRASDQGLFTLYRAEGLAFFVRTENPEPAFTRVCEDEYGLPPVRLAHEAFAKALAVRDDANTRLFYIASLWNAARFEMRQKRFTRAAGLWRKANAQLPFWLAAMESPDTHAELKTYYHDVEAYCALMGEAKKASLGEAKKAPMEEAKKEGENAAKNGTTLKALRDRIRANPFCDLTDELDDGSP